MGIHGGGADHGARFHPAPLTLPKRVAQMAGLKPKNPETVSQHFPSVWTTTVIAELTVLNKLLP